MTVSTSTIANPRDPYARKRLSRTNTELWAWLFMRVSGVILVVLIFGHLFVNLMVGDGVKAIDFAFVGGKWSSPFWQVWDLLMLWLAMIHGTNGVRTVINDYAEKHATRVVLKSLLTLGFVITVVLGTLVIFTFDSCPPGSPAELLPSFCTAA
ncbi:succinate dehydrogenase hydrophobic membrane anchor subunit [Timonella senegalensis]|uniref:succinate dehydrogenase hydrophobic membrane anchor subunit n=1 Tax=Timonella senegalensis TaxID=1465825 RepID=UPI0005909747|nr:succinate dehydrogenase hydrophobic membrane anchor subunit [Timonella senegalensis]